MSISNWPGGYCPGRLRQHLPGPIVLRWPSPPVLLEGLGCTGALVSPRVTGYSWACTGDKIHAPPDHRDGRPHRPRQDHAGQGPHRHRHRSPQGREGAGDLHRAGLCLPHAARRDAGRDRGRAGTRAVREDHAGRRGGHRPGDPRDRRGRSRDAPDAGAPAHLRAAAGETWLGGPEQGGPGGWGVAGDGPVGRRPGAEGHLLGGLPGGAVLGHDGPGAAGPLAGHPGPSRGGGAQADGRGPPASHRSGLYHQRVRDRRDGNAVVGDAQDRG